MTPQSKTTTRRRYYGQDNQVDALLDLTPLLQTLHGLYTRWVAQKNHEREFTVAIAHCADVLFMDYVLDGSPVLEGPSLVIVPLARAVFPSKPLERAAHRFYDEDGDLNPAIDVSMHRPSLAPHFVNWVQDGWLPRDFTQAARDCAATMNYDHQLCRSLGGLGGGRNEYQFLNEPYRE